MTHHYFASCPRGLEEVLQQELMEIHANDIKRVDGGMLFSGDKEVLYKANLSSRIATRILCLVKQGSYENEDDIFNAALSVEWTTWFAR